MQELPLLTDRGARRVYQTLAWLHSKRPVADRESLRHLRAQAFRLGLRAEAARQVEALARAGSVRIGRDPEEYAWLQASLADMTQRDPALKAKARELLRIATGKVQRSKSGRVSHRDPFEASEEGPPVAPVDTSKIRMIVPQAVAGAWQAAG